MSIHNIIKPGLLAVACLPFILASCDEGDIPNKVADVDRSGRTARLEGSVVKADEWPAGYSVALAGFGDADEYAMISKTVDPSALEKTGTMTLSGVPADVTSIELCVIDRLRRRVASFVTVKCDAAGGEVVITADGTDVGPMAAVQSEVFNTTCANCHGASNHAAAGLSLLAGESHAQLVGARSTVEAESMRVVAGNPDESLLWEILSTDKSASWRYDHSVEVVSTVRLDLVRNWIMAGAPE